jgi:hypothetical protein
MVIVTKFSGPTGPGTGSRVDTFEWVLQGGGENDSASWVDAIDPVLCDYDHGLHQR